jgi:hypothetical protein
MSFKEEYEKKDLFDMPPKFEKGDVVSLDNVKKIIYLDKDVYKSRFGRIWDVRRDGDEWKYEIDPMEPSSILVHTYTASGKMDVEFNEDELSLDNKELKEEYEKEDLFDLPPKFVEGDIVKIDRSVGKLRINDPDVKIEYYGSIWEKPRKKNYEWYYKIEPIMPKGEFSKYLYHTYNKNSSPLNMNVDFLESKLKKISKEEYNKRNEGGIVLEAHRKDLFTVDFEIGEVVDIDKSIELFHHFSKDRNKEWDGSHRGIITGMNYSSPSEYTIVPIRREYYTHVFWYYNKPKDRVENNKNFYFPADKLTLVDEAGKLHEEWKDSFQINGRTIEVFKNPTSNEIPKSSKGTYRGILNTKDNSIWVWDSMTLHLPVGEKLFPDFWKGLGEKYIRLTFDPKAKTIYNGEDIAGPKVIKINPNIRKYMGDTFRVVNLYEKW